MNRLILMASLLITTHVATAEMGRLFLTPTERARLDELRAAAKSVEIIDTTGMPEVPVAVAPPSDVSVQGYVKRSDGKKSTVWVNGQPVQEESSGAGVEVGKIQRGSNQVPLMLPGSGRSLKLKAGQVYSPATDSVSEIGATSNGAANPEQAGTIGDTDLPIGDRPSRP